jgi:hypothetical protein
MYAHISKYLRISKYSLPIKIYAHILKYLRIPQNIRLHVKYSLISKYSLTSKIFAPYLKYLHIHKIYAPHQECSRLIIYNSNKAAVEIFAPYKRCMCPENRRPNSNYLGSAESPTSDSFSVWLKSSHVQVMLPLLQAVLKWGSALSGPAYMGGVSAVLYRLLYRHDLPKYSRPVQMFAAANISTFFLGKSKT